MRAMLGLLKKSFLDTPDHARHVGIVEEIIFGHS
jgi:hypothetical protein